MVKAYNAVGQATSSLHAMAILKVYQAKALKDQHKGSPDPGTMQELCTVTDYALQAKEVYHSGSGSGDVHTCGPGAPDVA